MHLTLADFDYLRALVAKHCAIVLTQEKAYLAESRLLVVARREGIASPTELIARLRGGNAEGLLQKIIEAMTINETSFFRNIQPFEVLRKQILPELLQRRAHVRRLSIWCGASSTGQEPYSLALLLREHFPQLKTWIVQILATDLCSEALTRARQGLYTQLEVNRGLPAMMLMKYFQNQGADWQLKEEIRSMVEFRQMNLIETWPTMPAHDVVFLRNVLIYFDVPTKKTILGKIRKQLQPDGYLILGSTESAHNLDDGYECHTQGGTSYYRVKSSQVIPIVTRPAGARG
jgi:chemotaxis protein methyltransferase CheR